MQAPQRPQADRTQKNAPQLQAEPYEKARSYRPHRTPKDYLTLVLKGFAMGSCDIIPGVSGGTMALILGVYEELIQSIRNLARPPFLGALVRGLLGETLRVSNWRFLLALGSGILLAILSLARLLEFLLATQAVLVWSFFFGLIAASVITVSARVRRWHAGAVLAFLLGTLLAFWLVGLTPGRTPETPWFLFLSGALAICAMILPGISGAFILVLLGKYEFVLGALNRGDLLTLLIVALGAGVGLIAFTQVLGWLLARYYNLALALLCGFMLGALRKIWPWKRGTEVELAEGLGVNVLPPPDAQLLVALALAALGFTLVYLFDRPGRS